MKVVSREEWTRARTALLVREKEFSREREALAQARRDLPWEQVTKDYVFDGPDGKLTLPHLFGDCGQLVIYHFMFPPEWDAGCPHCSFWADSFNGTLAHLRARDDERRLPVPGSGPEGPRRTRGRRPAVLGPPPRRVRFLIPASGCGS